MDLRDRFAAHFAAALVDALSDSTQIAARAYDLAEAMLRERDRRVDVDEEMAIAEEGEWTQPEGYDMPPDETIDPFAFMPPPHAALLDGPEPMEPEPEWASDDELPDWLEPPYDPRWELDARWSDANQAPSPQRISSRPPGPGLARTQPSPAADERKARGA